MTTYSDHRVWQDVYGAATPVRKDAYIKITMRDEAPVIQFRRNSHGEKVLELRGSQRHDPLRGQDLHH
jgi:hypothetical protein